MKATPLLILALLAFAPLVPTAAAANTCGETMLFAGGTPSTASPGTVTITATFQDALDHCGLSTWQFTFHRNGVYFSGPWVKLGSYATSGNNYVITADAILDAATWTVLVEARENCCGTAGSATGTGSWTIVVGNPNAACADGVDNDGDGLVDYPADPGCTSASDGNERGTATCDDGLDNDGDGLADSPADPGCTGPSDTSERGTTTCDDGLDNDGDGAIDYPADPGCASPLDVNERGTIACDDGADNDGDGTTDYPADPGCTGPSDASERGAAACDDGLDNDGDGLADYPADPGCASLTDTSERGTIACDDGIDNDGDGLVDYPADAGCTSPTDATETNDCGETAPLVTFCVAAGDEITPPLSLVEVVDGAQHHVAGYLDVYRFVLPVVGPVQLPCVTLLVDGNPVNPCDDHGTFVSRSATLVNNNANEPAVEEADLPDAVRVCHAEITLLVADFGLTAFQGYTIC